MSRIFSADVATAVTARGGTAARGKDGSLRCHLDGREAGDADRQGGLETGRRGLGCRPWVPRARESPVSATTQSLTAAGVHPARYLNGIPARPVH